MATNEIPPWRACRVCGGWETQTGDQYDFSVDCGGCGAGYSSSYGANEEKIGNWHVQYSWDEDDVAMSKLRSAREVAILICRWEMGLIADEASAALVKNLKDDPSEYTAAGVLADYLEERFPGKESERLAFYLRAYREPVGFQLAGVDE